ncbi:MAG TPA: hypothetical protein VF532_03735 [Candidatus Angelobacter sp.]
MQASLVQAVSNWLLPAAIFALEALTLFFLIKNKRRMGMPVFFSYLIFNMGLAIAFRIAQLGSAQQYFYIYWTLTAVGMIFNFLVLYEVFVNALKPFSAVIDLAKMLAGWAALFLLATGILSAFATSGSQSSRICTAISLIERSVQLMQCGVLLLMALFGSRLGLSWRAQGASVALGLGLTSAVGTIESYFTTQLSPYSNIVNLMDGMLWTAVVGFWAYTAMKPQPVRASVQNSPTRLILQRWNEALISYQHSGDLAFAPSESFLPSVERTVERVMARKMTN